MEQGDERFERMERRARRSIAAGAVVMVLFAWGGFLWSGLLQLGLEGTSVVPASERVVLGLAGALALAGFGAVVYGGLGLFRVGRRGRHLGPRAADERPG